MYHIEHGKRKNTSAQSIQLQLSRRMRDLREDNDLRQWQIAKLLNVDRTTYAHYESGRSRPDYEMIVKLAKHYGVSVDYLLGA